MEESCNCFQQQQLQQQRHQVFKTNPFIHRHQWHRSKRVPRSLCRERAQEIHYSHGLLETPSIWDVAPRSRKVIWFEARGYAQNQMTIYPFHRNHIDRCSWLPVLLPVGKVHLTSLCWKPLSIVAPSPQSSLQCWTTSPNASKTTTSPPLSHKTQTNLIWSAFVIRYTDRLGLICFE